MQTPLPEHLLPLGPLEQLISMGGPVMVVLLAMAILGLITFVYLMLYGTLFAPRGSRRLRKFIQDWKQSPDQTVVDRFRNKNRGLRRLNPLNHLVLMVMESRLRNQNADEIRETVAQKAQQTLTPFEAPLKVIEVIAALAPLLGLLGTVLGMMEAFSTMAAAEGRASASQLSGGIYQALTTTAAGLIVAIPFAALAAWIEFRLRRLQTNLNLVLMDTLVETPSLQQPSVDHSNAAPAEPPSQAMPKTPTPESDWGDCRALANAVR